MSDAKSASTPADPSVRLCREGTRDNPQSEKVTAPNREIMGSLNYAMIGTRPDIAFAVGLLSRFSQDPRMPHYAAAKRILSYLKGTADVGLLLGKRQSEKENRLTCHVDSSYADDFDTRRSTSGLLIMYNDAPVIWKSRLQSMVTHSTTEAEFIAASYACKEVQWLRQLLHELNRDEALATPVHIDNQGALKLIANRQVHARTKHLDIRYMSIRELETNGVIETKYIGTEKQLADLLTKALYRDRFSILREAINCTSVNMMRQENDILCASNVNLSTTCNLTNVNKGTVHRVRRECKNDIQESYSTSELRGGTSRTRPPSRRGTGRTRPPTRGGTGPTRPPGDCGADLPRSSDGGGSGSGSSTTAGRLGVSKGDTRVILREGHREGRLKSRNVNSGLTF